VSKLWVLLMVIALGCLTLFPPWVLTRTVSINGEGFWSLKEKTGSSETWTEMEGSQEIARLGHHPLWAFTTAASNPTLSIRGGPGDQTAETHRAEIAGLVSAKLDIRLLLSEYSVVLLVGLILNSWSWRKATTLG
jgi:hypothetical protein